MMKPGKEQIIAVPPIWQRELCTMHEDFNVDCFMCAEEIVTGKTENAWKAGYRAGLAAAKTLQND